MQVTDLVSGFIKHYDAENPGVVSFRQIRNSVLASWSARGFHCWQNAGVVQIGGKLREYVEKKGRFIWEKLQEIIISTNPDFYADLSSDLKVFLAKELNPTLEAAKNYLEQMRKEANAPTGIITEASQKFQNLLIGFDAEIEFFCAKFALARSAKQQAVSNQTVQIGEFKGIFGDVSNSHVSINDFSVVHHILCKQGISKEARRELEDIMEDLNTASPAQKPSMVEKGEKWLEGHKEALGGYSELFSRIVRGESENF